MKHLDTVSPLTYLIEAFSMWYLLICRPNKSKPPEPKPSKHNARVSHYSCPIDRVCLQFTFELPEGMRWWWKRRTKLGCKLEYTHKHHHPAVLAHKFYATYENTKPFVWLAIRACRFDGIDFDSGGGTAKGGLNKWNGDKPCMFWNRNSPLYFST